MDRQIYTGGRDEMMDQIGRDCVAAYIIDRIGRQVWFTSELQDALRSA